MDPLYNHDVVLAAARRAADREPNLKLAFIRPSPPNDYVRTLEELVQDQGMQHLVRWLPFQDSMDRLGQIYRMCDVVVSIPSSEGYGMTVYECLAAGSALIISDLPVFTSTVKDGVDVMKVPVRSVAATEAALSRLAEDDRLRENLEARSQRSGALVTIEERVERILNLYYSLATQSKR
jgi:glycosyltransferase involved in cell wall biosynthesis